MERIFDLAVTGDGTARQSAGYTGQITANSFMKREFGKKLIEEFIRNWDLTHVIDTSGAYIPGHGTPTVILFGKNQPPVRGTICTVLGVRGEPEVPQDPAQGHVWRAICNQIDHAGSESEWVSSSQSPRADFHKHPWSIGGGGLRELKDVVESASTSVLDDEIETICAVSYTRLDEAYLVSGEVLSRQGVPQQHQIEFVSGDNVRDWQLQDVVVAGFPYNLNLEPLPISYHRGIHCFLWPFREDLWRRREINGDHRELERTWWEWNRFLVHRFQEPRSISFAEIATHNNFVFDSQRRAFSQTAPVIKPKSSTSTEDCTKLVGILNSSTGCFWMKQVCFPKGGSGIGRGIQSEFWEGRFAFDGTKIRRFPLLATSQRPSQLPSALIGGSASLTGLHPSAILASWSDSNSGSLCTLFSNAQLCWNGKRQQLIAWQEELDWQIYEAFGFIESDDHVSLPEDEAKDAVPSDGIQLGERAFEIVLARRMAAGEVQTTWFARHGSTPITEVPAHWPKAYRELVERRIARIESDANIRLIEQPEYKRRWNTEPWEKSQQEALRQWLLARLEGYFHEGSRVCDLAGTFDPAAHGFNAAARPHLVSANQLADVVQSDVRFLDAAEVYVGAAGFSVPKLVRELVESESVPALPRDRYKDSGLRKRQDWEETWRLQRLEDAVDEEVRSQGSGVNEEELKKRIRKAQLEKVGEIPVPPKYASTDFKKASHWKLRGKLDVPKERWICYPGAERAGDDSPLIAWAGWDHLQQAQALAEYFIDAQTNQGWPPSRLKPLLAALADLIPWLKQWHNAHDPAYGMGLGDYFAGFLEEQCRALGMTVQEVDAIRFEAAEPTARTPSRTQAKNRAAVRKGRPAESPDDGEVVDGKQIDK
jgi:hypothetical protein